MSKTRIGLSFSDADLERIAALQEVLGTRNRTETISVAVQLALSLKTDPIGSLAAAGVHFESAINIEIKDGKVLVRAPLTGQEKSMTTITDSDIRAGLWAKYGHPDDDYTASISGPEPDFDLPGQWRISFHKGDMPAFETQCFDEADSLRATMLRIQPDLSAWHDYEGK